MHFLSWLALLFYCLILTDSCNALCFDQVEEYHQCSGPAAISMNSTWYGNVSTWYIPLWNKVEVYENALLILGHEGFHELSPQVVEIDSCTYYRQNGSKEIWHSFTSLSLEYTVYPDPIRPGVSHYSTVDKANHENFGPVEDYIATAYTTMTDNATFLVTICYWADGRKGFLVSSPLKTLEFQTFNLIERHLVQYGFSPKYFVFNDYERCF